MNVLLIDNNDSFTYNLIDLLRSFPDVKTTLCSTESFSVEQLNTFDKIIFSPGPGLPEEHPEMFRILSLLSGKKPMLGICLGMQAIGLHFGARLFNLSTVIHGQTRQVSIIQPNILFKELPHSIEVGLYHSWAVDTKEFPHTLESLAFSEDGVVMALQHSTYPIYGVQFHPESHLTPLGSKIIENFLFQL